jgi:hypothetical protein
MVLTPARSVPLNKANKVFSFNTNSGQTWQNKAKLMVTGVQTEPIQLRVASDKSSWVGQPTNSLLLSGTSSIGDLSVSDAVPSSASVRGHIARASGGPVPADVTRASARRSCGSGSASCAAIQLCRVAALCRVDTDSGAHSPAEWKWNPHELFRRTESLSHHTKRASRTPSADYRQQRLWVATLDTTAFLD